MEVKPTKRKRIDFEHPLMKKMKTMIEDDQNSSDEEIKQSHPNRRLERETSQNLPIQQHIQTYNNRCSGNLSKHINIKKSRCLTKTSIEQSEIVKIEKTDSLESTKFSKGLKLSTTPDDLTVNNSTNNSMHTPCFKIFKFLKPKLKEIIGSDKKTTFEEEQRIVSDSSKAPVKTPVAEQWRHIVDTSELWEGELGRSFRRFECWNERTDYSNLLSNYVKYTTTETLYERMFKKKLNDPNFRFFLSEFYISPATVEALYPKLIDNLTTQEALKLVCEHTKWPKPEYVQQSSQDKNEYRYSCILKNVEFVSADAATNRELAKELAAFQCLSWLGLEQKPFSDNCSFTDTYFK